MDTTLIKTKSGKKVPKDACDWQLLYPEVPEIIKRHYDNGYKIVILSNQGNLNFGIIKVKDFKIKIEKLVQKIGVPMQVCFFFIFTIKKHKLESKYLFNLLNN